MAQNKVNFGLKNLHYALINELTIAGNTEIIYSKPISFPGSVNLEMEIAGETSNFYADDIVYYTTSSNQGYTVTLEVASLTEEFRRDVLGEVFVNGILAENATVQPRKVAFLFEFDGDAKATRHCLTYCTVTRPGLSGATATETKEPGTQELTVTALPRPTDKLPKFSTSSITENDVYANWYSAVQDVTIDSTIVDAVPTGTASTAANYNTAQTLTISYDAPLYSRDVALANNANVLDFIAYKGASYVKTAVYTTATTTTQTAGTTQAATTTTYAVTITLNAAATASNEVLIVDGLTGNGTKPINEVYVFTAGTTNRWAKQ